jgi:hypothetical protein
MRTNSQIQNRLDAGDLSGATRLAAREKIAELKTQRDAALTSAMEQFYDAHPEFGEQWKFYTKLMRSWLVAGGVDPAGATYQDLENAWRGIKGKRIRSVESTAAHPVNPIQSQPQAPPAEDSITVEARDLISSGRISLATINAMSNSQYELASRSAVFCKVLEILEPRREPTPLTRGELAAAAGQANLTTDSGIPATVAQKVEELEAWKRRHFENISTAQTPASGPQRGVVNLHQAGHIPKLATETQLAAAIKKQKEDQKFLEEVALKMERARRVKAHRGRQ